MDLEKDLSPEYLQEILGGPEEIGFEINLERTRKKMLGLVEVKRELDQADCDSEARIDKRVSSKDADVRLIVNSEHVDSVLAMIDELGVVNIVPIESQNVLVT